ncbi:MAG: molybdopterin molybdotransferase MoeA [Bacteroidales bacterium]|nr:molybdopterin molybdotransferase MoeA [Bacteroidales bacterium]
MISFEEAYHIVINAAQKTAGEKVELGNSLGRVLATDVFSDMDMPPFNKSAVDGYACRRDDLAAELEVIETIPAGKSPEKQITPGKCSKVMTGGMVPEGADIVIMVEDVLETGSNKIRYVKDKTSGNICYTGEDIRKHDKVLERGTLIRPQEIAVLASVGVAEPLVYKQPVVGIISTGDELVEPQQTPAISQIRNSNAAQLVAQVKCCHAIPAYFGIARDTEASTREMIIKALEASDIVLLTGGVSMGDFDYVPKVLNEIGFEIKFKSIAVQPGRPTVFATREGKYLFGLPGNPVSSFVQFELLVKPLIYQMMGNDFRPMGFELPMGKTYSRKKAKRKSFLPVTIKNSKIWPLEYHGSAHIHSYIYADGIIAVEIGNTTLEEGELVHVRQI